jgi:hypothetical protein
MRSPVACLVDRVRSRSSLRDSGSTRLKPFPAVGSATSAQGASRCEFAARRETPGSDRRIGHSRRFSRVPHYGSLAVLGRNQWAARWLIGLVSGRRGSCTSTRALTRPRMQLLTLETRMESWSHRAGHRRRVGIRRSRRIKRCGWSARSARRRVVMTGGAACREAARLRRRVGADVGQAGRHRRREQAGGQHSRAGTDPEARAGEQGAAPSERDGGIHR